MRKLGRGISGKSGLPPGTLIHIGERKRDTALFTVFRYNESTIEERSSTQLSELSLEIDAQQVLWVNMDGIHQTELLEKLGNRFGLHPLVMEDILNTHERPKLEDNGDTLYLVTKMLYFDEKNNEIDVEQVSLILGQAYLLTFQEREGDVFEPIRTRLRKGTGKLNRTGSDYLLYSLLDAIIDNYFVILEKLGEKIDLTEDALIYAPKQEILRSLHELKRVLLFSHKSVWPMREALSSLERGNSDLLNESTGVYFRDIYDHIVQVMDIIDTYREVLSSMLDIYLSGISNRMNEIMKVLAIISTIFMPMTFLAGIYGMNFVYMPELQLPWGYPVLLGVMVVLALAMLYYFRRKKWI